VGVGVGVGVGAGVGSSSLYFGLPYCIGMFNVPLPGEKIVQWRFDSDTFGEGGGGGCPQVLPMASCGFSPIRGG